MGTRSAKKLFDGLSARNAKPRLAEIWKKDHPELTFNRMNKDFTKQYGISFLALAETWHRLRSQNKTVEFMIQAFAGAIAKKNKANHDLSETIHKQRAQLEKLQNSYNALAGAVTHGE